jgi:hypothetical protein
VRAGRWLGTAAAQEPAMTSTLIARPLVVMCATLSVIVVKRQ